ncbi:MAG: hypothetical protein KGL39_01550 [Patescibacteria group bacterium]|nr:hypothetical protein [Patescibacteria group bacterium]
MTTKRATKTATTKPVHLPIKAVGASQKHPIQSKSKADDRKKEELVAIAVWDRICPIAYSGIKAVPSGANTAKQVFQELKTAIAGASSADVELLQSTSWKQLGDLVGRCSKDVYRAVASVRGVALILGPTPLETLVYESITPEDAWKMRSRPKQRAPVALTSDLLDVL